MTLLNYKKRTKKAIHRQQLVYDNYNNYKSVSLNINNHKLLQIVHPRVLLSILKNVSFQYNYVISLTTIPTRLVKIEFMDIIRQLALLCPKVKMIVLNICRVYKHRSFSQLEIPIHIIQQIKDLGIVINECDDYGPSTKFLGLLENQLSIEEEDKIIILDDDWIYHPNMIEMYELCYQLYQCDGVFINERDLILWDNNFQNGIQLLDPEHFILFYDDYQNFCYGWLSYSIRWKHLKKSFAFYQKMIVENESIYPSSSIIYHDDLIFTLFYKSLSLYMCGMNLLLFNSMNRTPLDHYDALRTNSNHQRFQLEESFFQHYKIPHRIKNHHLYIENHYTPKLNITIPSTIPPRNLLINIKDCFVLDSSYEKYPKQIDCKYINSNHMLITITYYTSSIPSSDIIYISIQNQIYAVIIHTHLYSNKYTYIIKTPISIYPHSTLLNQPPLSIVQTNQTSSMSLYKFYSINSILSYIPYCEYHFYTEEKRDKYIQSIHPIIYFIYSLLNVVSYKVDLFRILFLYLKGGFYFDCKTILLNPIDTFFHLKEIYTKTFNMNCIENGSLCFFESKSNLLLKYLYHSLTNVWYLKYTDDHLGITGPTLFYQLHPVEETPLQMYYKNNDWKSSFVKDVKNKDHYSFIQKNYKGYYEENNYLRTKHYSILYLRRQVYNQKQVPIPYHKLNGIDHIVWINLDRCIDRKHKLLEHLQQISIPNTRISAVDGKLENVTQYFPSSSLTSYEIACTLSHIKAISYLFHLNLFKDNSYFLVIEDDADFVNLFLINCDLKTIIENAPSTFDILLLSKTYIQDLTELYTDWNVEYSKGSDYHIASTVAYIITKKGIEKLIEKIYWKDDQWNIQCNDIKEADKFLYSHCNTFVYRYNVIESAIFPSEIHNEHLEWHLKSNEKQLSLIIENLIKSL